MRNLLIGVAISVLAVAVAAWGQTLSDFASPQDPVAIWITTLVFPTAISGAVDKPAAAYYDSSLAADTKGQVTKDQWIAFWHQESAKHASTRVVLVLRWPKADVHFQYAFDGVIYNDAHDKARVMFHVWANTQDTSLLWNVNDVLKDYTAPGAVESKESGISNVFAVKEESGWKLWLTEDAVKAVLAGAQPAAAKPGQPGTGCTDKFHPAPGVPICP